MDKIIKIDDETFNTNTFRGTVEALRSIGVPLSQPDNLIEVTVWDYIAGETVMPMVKMDEYNAVRVFGDLCVNGIDLAEGHMVFILNSADCETWNSPIKYDE